MKPRSSNASTSNGTNGESIIAAWHVNHRATSYLIENLPAELWPKTIPGNPRRSVRSLAAHVHNARCMWIKMIGSQHGLSVPARVNLSTVSRVQLLSALKKSDRGIVGLINFGLARGGILPGAAWQNFPPDVTHFVSYFVAHEAHHRGQLCLVARQLGHRLPAEVTNGLWQWKERAQE